MDSYLHLCKLGDRCEDLGLQVRKEGGREEAWEGGREGGKAGRVVWYAHPFPRFCYYLGYAFSSRPRQYPDGDIAKKVLAQQT